MTDSNPNLSGIIFEELSNKGILDLLNAKLLSKVAHEVQNSNIDIEKNPQRIQTSEENKIAFLLVMNYLKNKGMNETYRTIVEELPNNPVFNFKLTPSIADELYMVPEKCPDVTSFLVQSNYDQYKFEFYEKNRNFQLQGLEEIIKALSTSASKKNSNDPSKKSKHHKK